MKFVDILESVVAESVVVIKKLLQMQVSLKSFSYILNLFGYIYTAFLHYGRNFIACYVCKSLSSFNCFGRREYLHRCFILSNLLHGFSYNFIIQQILAIRRYGFTQYIVYDIKKLNTGFQD